jgi:hypothetical protein
VRTNVSTTSGANLSADHYQGYTAPPSLSSYMVVVDALDECDNAVHIRMALQLSGLEDTALHIASSTQAKDGRIGLGGSRCIARRHSKMRTERSLRKFFAEMRCFPCSPSSLLSGGRLPEQSHTGSVKAAWPGEPRQTHFTIEMY